jgi:hypothetical protein
MRMETKFLRLRTPVDLGSLFGGAGMSNAYRTPVKLGFLSDDWQVCGANIECTTGNADEDPRGERRVEKEKRRRA